MLYLVILATLVSYASWGHLLQRYPTGAVAPFALLSPCTGVVSAAVVFGETFTPVRLTGMALIFAGLATIVVPGGVLGRIGCAWKLALRVWR